MFINDAPVRLICTAVKQYVCHMSVHNNFIQRRSAGIGPKGERNLNLKCMEPKDFRDPCPVELKNAFPQKEGPYATRYPLVFVHGLFMRDDPGGCWGCIPHFLRCGGAAVFFGGQDAVGSIETNALQLKQRICSILEQTGAKKVNLIAHSKGGLDARYMISNLNMHASVASLTTIATPHRGTEAADIPLRWPWMLRGLTVSFLNRWFRSMGDASPNVYAALTELTPDFCKRFNRHVPNHPEVSYQSYGCRMSCAGSDWRLFLPYALILRKSRDNDGLVSPESAAWAYYKGLVTGSVKGVSHWNAIDWHWGDICGKRRERMPKKLPGVACFYSRLVKELKAAGF